MKFGKSLERTMVVDIPEDWRPYVIQYKSLKRCIARIVQELDAKGLHVQVLKKLLSEVGCAGTSAGGGAGAPQIEYAFVGTTKHAVPLIKVTVAEEKRDDRARGHYTVALTATTTLAQNENLPDIVKAVLLSSDGSGKSSPSDGESTQPSPVREDAPTDTRAITAPSISQEPNLVSKTVFIEIQNDTEFFLMLSGEVAQQNILLEENRTRFQNKATELGDLLAAVTSPYKSDMYAWREILRLYLEAEIFVGGTEADRSTHPWDMSQRHLDWFSEQMNQLELGRKLKMGESKRAFESFFKLNMDLIAIKHFQELNETAMVKILKKHDKRTSLTASYCFPQFMRNDPLYNKDLTRTLCFTISCNFLTVVPQPEDYSCAVCMCIYWKPIRLTCGHVFCVRCLVKAQRRRMPDCPVCRRAGAVHAADASCLDTPLLNLLKLYFPKEIKAKKRDMEREKAAEEMELFTGRAWTEESRAQTKAECAVM